ncbi:hypothetical protein ACF09J_31900 [Streptomyces sp. NPDC014889]|uniref:hypothetical protein n=1 Tax=Streptomyces sp. NPDC014889 TaxID=3364928 RepID=UPI0036F8D49E
MKAYLGKVAEEKEQERALQTATAAFRRAMSEPGVMDAFDAEFGGLPSVAHDTPRAARPRAVNAPHLVALVRAVARFERGRLVERPEAVAA